MHAPDLYEGRVFTDLAERVLHAERELGFETFLERGRRVAEALPSELVYAGLSLGVLPAQMLAQTRRGAKGALLLYSTVPPAEFGDGWPDGVPLQIHMMDGDPFALEGDLEVARELAATLPEVELFEYPGGRHLFADITTPDYDEPGAALLKERVSGWLTRII